MRYAGANNFTGQPLPGYDAAECVLRRDVAEALARVAADLARENLGLKVYDCYRPDPRGRRFCALGARIRKSGRRRRDQALLSRRWRSAACSPTAISPRTRRIRPATRSTSRLLNGPPRPRRPSIRTHLTAPARGLPRSARPTMRSTWAPASTASTTKATREAPPSRPTQKRWRARLVAAMRARGFHNYFREWWHFTFGTRGKAYDFPIAPRP